MTYGSVLIKQCSKCLGLFREYGISSYNTFHAVYWTDGYMIPSTPIYMSRIIKCPNCEKLIWKDIQKKIDEFDFTEEYPTFLRDTSSYSSKKAKKYNKVKEYKKPEFEDYFKILNNNHYTKENEVYIRKCAWWSGNDKRRFNTQEQINMSIDEKVNIEFLSNLLNNYTESDIIMLAEIQRELGYFKDSIKLLDSEFSDKYKKTVFVIKELAKQKCQVVKRIN